MTGLGKLVALGYGRKEKPSSILCSPEITHSFVSVPLDLSFFLNFLTKNLFPQLTPRVGVLYVFTRLFVVTTTAAPQCATQHESE